MVEHVSITDPEIHEPKGASTATVDQVYIADGAGSGTWTTWPFGWGFYKDNASAQTFNTTAAKLSIDGAGSSTEESYLPREIRGSDSLWDTTNDDITPIALGDAYALRLDLPITAKTGSPGELLLELDISSGSTPTTVIVERRVTIDPTPPYNVSIAFPIFVGSTFIANGGQIFLTTDTGTVDITAPGIFLSRISGSI